MACKVASLDSDTDDTLQACAIRAMSAQHRLRNSPPFAKGSLHTLPGLQIHVTQLAGAIP